MRHAQKLIPLLLVAAVAACGGDGTATGPDGGQQATGAIVGQVEETTTASASLSPDFSTTSSADASANGMTVAAARVQSDGGLETVAEDEVASDGSFRIESVPAGESGLVVVVSEAGEERGRALLHGSVPADDRAFAAPIDRETTAEGRVLSELRSMGIAPEAINTAELAASIDLGGEGADQVLSSTDHLTALAEGARDYQQIYTEVLSGLGISLDAAAREEAATDAARQYAEDRVNGAAEESAEEQRNGSIADAYREAGADEEAQVQASSAAGTGLNRAAQQVPDQARLDIARGASEVSLLARERQVEAALSSLNLPTDSADEARAAIDDARQAVDQAQSLSELETGVAGAMDRAQAAMEGGLADRLPSQAQDALSGAFDNVPDQAGLESRLQNATDASGVSTTYVSFFEDLRSAVMSGVQDIRDAGGQVDGQAVADFFTGIRGRVEIP